MVKTILLVGGLGFIGRNIFNYINQNLKGFDTVIVDDCSNSCDNIENFRPKNTITADYLNPSVKNFVNSISGKKIHIFLAGETRVAEASLRPLDFINANIVKPSKYVQDNVHEGDIFSLITTAGALYDGTKVLEKHSLPKPKNIYGETKLAEERIIQQLCNLKGANYRSIRMTNVFGPYSDKKLSAIHAFIRSGIKNQKIFINGDGNQRRDFVYANDAAKAIIEHSILDETDEITSTIGSHRSVSINDIINIIRENLLPNLSIEYRSAKQLINTEPRDVVLGNSLKNPYVKNFVPLLEGLRLTLDYYLKQIE
jgi:UDP-glucose 4-epimerase